VKGGIKVSRKNNRDFIYLIWKDPNTRRNFTVGELSKNGQYEFSYGHEINEAIEKGFEPLISFEDINKIYTSDTLFPTFSSRLPDRKRRGLEKILAKYDLLEYDAYRLLKRSGAKLPIDNLEFIDPIFEESDSDVIRMFHIAGSRHHIRCEGGNCDSAIRLKKGQQLRLEMDSENIHDENAIKIVDTEGNTLGFVPRYYSYGVTGYLKKGIAYKCTVLEVNKSGECDECIKVKLEINVSSECRKTS